MVLERLCRPRCRWCGRSRDWRRHWSGFLRPYHFVDSTQYRSRCHDNTQYIVAGRTYGGQELAGGVFSQRVLPRGHGHLEHGAGKTRIPELANTIQILIANRPCIKRLVCRSTQQIELETADVLRAVLRWCHMRPPELGSTHRLATASEILCKN